MDQVESLFFSLQRAAFSEKRGAREDLTSALIVEQYETIKLEYCLFTVLA